MKSKHISQSEFESFEERKRARFINTLSGFKSANLIGTKDENGLTNLSIVSSVVHLGASPALMGLVIRPDVSPRHTLENILQTKSLTINHVNSSIFKQAHQTSGRYGKEQSEFTACHLSEEYHSDHYAPFVKESHIKIALELIREIKIEENGTHFLICAIKDVYLPLSCLSEDGSIDIESADSIAVSGLDKYHKTNKLARLSYAKPGKELLEID
jgi:flavin reductase (DIM6/NTAB) family NADH-FMN oxidoreductase RutF